MELDGRRIRVDYYITSRAHSPTPGRYMGWPTRLLLKAVHQAISELRVLHGVFASNLSLNPVWKSARKKNSLREEWEHGGVNYISAGSICCTLMRTHCQPRITDYMSLGIYARCGLTDPKGLTSIVALHCTCICCYIFWTFNHTLLGQLYTTCMRTVSAQAEKFACTTHACTISIGRLFHER